LVVTSAPSVNSAVLRDRRGGLARLRGGVGIVLLADRFHLGERAIAIGADPGGLGSGACALEVGLGFGCLRLIEAGIDLVERLAGADDRAFGEEAPLDDPCDLRPHLGSLERRHAARKLGDQRHVARLHHDEADLCRAAGALFLRAVAAAAAARSDEKGRGDQRRTRSAGDVRSVQIQLADPLLRRAALFSSENRHRAAGRAATRGELYQNVSDTIRTYERGRIHERPLPIGERPYPLSAAAASDL
jgi:hypothetical protein